MENIITGFIVLGFLIYFLVQGKNKSKMGINLNRVSCPVCHTKQPTLRIPANLNQALYGGHTCRSCKSEMDKYGDIVS